MASIYRRGGKLWMRIREGGSWVSRTTPYAVGQERDALRYAKRKQERIAEHEAKGLARIIREGCVGRPLGGGAALDGRPGVLGEGL